MSNVETAFCLEQRDLVDITGEILAGLIDSDMFYDAAEGPGAETIAATITILGENANSELLIAAEPSLARAVAIAFFGPDDGESDSWPEAMRELSNIVGGGLKGFVPQPATLDIPRNAELGDLSPDHAHVATSYGILTVNFWPVSPA